MSYTNSKTIKEIIYKKYLIKIKKDGDCFILNPSRKLFTWAEHLKCAKLAINVSIAFDKKYNKA